MRFHWLILALFCLPCWASDIYFDLASAGSNNGTNCANARAYSSMAAGDYVAGNVLHVCGTGTASAGASPITTQGSGSNGNPITIKFETGAVLQASYFSSAGAIVVNHAYITIDGGTNGIIQNTLNGSVGATCPGGACTQNQVSAGVVGGSGASNMIVQNLTVQNMFVRVNNTSTIDGGGGADTTGISAGAANNRITNNTVTFSVVGISLGAQFSAAHLEIDHNTLSACNHAIGGGVAGTSITKDDIKIHDNDFAGNAQMWDDTADEYHRNGVQIIADSSSCTNCAITNLQFYNNYFHGSWSRPSITQMNSFVFLDDQGSNTITATIFNNVATQDAADGSFDCSYIVCQSQNTSDTGLIVVNNTIAPALHNNGTCSRTDNEISMTMKNNIFSQCGYDFFNHGSIFTTPSIDYNFWYDTVVKTWLWPPSCGSGCNFAAWQTAGFDTHSSSSTTVNPNLNSNFTLPAGSAAIGAATNLTSLGITALDTGAPQTFGVGGTCGTGCITRPSTGAWDAGAYPASGPQTPTFSPNGGTFTTNPSVTITCGSGATCCYTTNGVTPTAATPGTCDQSTYSTPITIPSTLTLKAIGTEVGFTNSSVQSALFTMIPLIAPGTLAFGNQTVNTTSAGQVETFTNNTGATITFTSVALTTGTQFAISANTCTGTLTNTSSCTTTITFTPTTAGAKSDTLTYTDSDASSPQTVGLTGTGVAGGGGSAVTLTRGVTMTQGTTVVQ